MGGGELVCRLATLVPLKPRWLQVGTLSKDDDDSSENVGKKMNLRSFKLNRVYLDPLKMATFPGVEFLRILFRFKTEQEGKFVVVCSRSPDYVMQSCCFNH